MITTRSAPPTAPAEQSPHLAQAPAPMPVAAAPAALTPAPAEDRAARLAKLRSLREEDLIDEETYQAKVREIEGSSP